MEGHKLARSVFVGNLSYDATDEEITEFLRKAGPVNAFRLVRDKDTGRSKGFGFCEYKNPEHAQFAIKSMRNMLFKGRTLRVGQSNKDYNAPDINNDNNSVPNFSNSSKSSMDTNFGQTPTFPNANNFQSQNMPVHPIPLEFIKLPPILPQPENKQVPREIPQPLIEPNFPDDIAALNAEQLYQLMLEIKNLINQNPNEARKLLTKDTKLLYTLLYSQLLMKNIDPQITIAMLNRTDDQIPQVEHESGVAPTNIKNPAYNYNGEKTSIKKQNVKSKVTVPNQQPTPISSTVTQPVIPVVNASSLPMPPNMPEFNASSNTPILGKHKSSRAAKLPLPKIPKMEPVVSEFNSFSKASALPMPPIKSESMLPRTSDPNLLRNTYNNTASSSSLVTPVANLTETPSQEQIVELMQQLSKLSEEQVLAIPAGERDIVISLRKQYMEGQKK